MKVLSGAPPNSAFHTKGVLGTRHAPLSRALLVLSLDRTVTSCLGRFILCAANDEEVLFHWYAPRHDYHIGPMTPRRMSAELPMVGSLCSISVTLRAFQPGVTPVVPTIEGSQSRGELRLASGLPIPSVRGSAGLRSSRLQRRRDGRRRQRQSRQRAPPLRDSCCRGVAAPNRSPQDPAREG